MSAARAVVGPALVVVGVCHTGLTPLLYPGVVATGLVVTSVEHHVAPLPRSLPWVLLGVGVWGVALLPRSPFWVLGVLAGVAEGRRRRSGSVRRAEPRGVQ